MSERFDALDRIVAEELPGVSDGRRRSLTALAGLAAWVVFRDRHLSSREVGALGSALARVRGVRREERARLPLWALRERRGDRDGLYVFGRRTLLLLPQRGAPCPVAQHLDALLRDRA